MISFKYFILIFLLISNLSYGKDLFYYQNGKKIYLHTLKRENISRDKNEIAYYNDNKGHVVGVKNSVILRLKKGTPIELYLKKYRLSLVKSLGRSTYVLKTLDSNRTIDIANQLNNETNVLYCQPNFYKFYMRR